MPSKKPTIFSLNWWGKTDLCYFVLTILFFRYMENFLILNHLVFVRLMDKQITKGQWVMHPFGVERFLKVARPGDPSTLWLIPPFGVVKQIQVDFDNHTTLFEGSGMYNATNMSPSPKVLIGHHIGLLPICHPLCGLRLILLEFVIWASCLSWRFCSPDQQILNLLRLWPLVLYKLVVSG